MTTDRSGGKRVREERQAEDRRPKDLPPQHQERQPGMEGEMHPAPRFEAPEYRAAGKLEGKVALITGGDSGIGRSVAVYFAKEGADVAIVYLDEHEDAEETERQVEEEGCRCLLIPGDVQDEAFCRDAVERTVGELGRLDVLVNNAAVQYPRQSLEEITSEQLEKTFRTNILAMFHLTKAALKHLQAGSSIINTTSVTAYRGNPTLIDYSSTKGAILSFTRALAMNLAKQGIRVNAVAPGPIWTPLIPASFSAEKVDEFGTGQPLGRPGQPEEVAPSYVFLASSDSSYISGQTLHPNGGEPVGG
jgi:NAD(P)-dependent dehydrogenase (short-subunit alcohol dehydrogenase family)